MLLHLRQQLVSRCASGRRMDTGNFSWYADQCPLALLRGLSCFANAASSSRSFSRSFPIFFISRRAVAKPVDEASGSAKTFRWIASADRGRLSLCAAPVRFVFRGGAWCFLYLVYETIYVHIGANFRLPLSPGAKSPHFSFSGPSARSPSSSSRRSLGIGASTSWNSNPAPSGSLLREKPAGTGSVAERRKDVLGWSVLKAGRAAGTPPVFR